MKQTRWMISSAILSVLLIAACAFILWRTYAPAQAAGSTGVWHTAGGWHTAGSGGGTAVKKYTKADYTLALSFMTDGWQEMSVDDFNAKLLNVEEEEAYHKVEDALLRVVWTLEEKDPNAAFLLGSLRTSLYECRIRHYNSCVHDQLPSWDGYVERIKYEDVYGDQVEAASGYGNYWFRYRIADGSKTTVARRDAFLRDVEKGMQDFLDKQTEADLKKQESMKKALSAELIRLTGAYGGTEIAAEGCEADYYWNSYY